MITMKSLVETLSSINKPDIDKESIKKSKEDFLSIRISHGFKSIPRLLTDGSENIKLSKSEIKTYGLSLAPARVSRVANMCPKSTKGCRDLCINTSGSGLYPKVQLARISKTDFMVKHPESFLTLLRWELFNASQKDEIAVRLNVYSDIPWEDAAGWIFEEFESASFYDYTKDKDRLRGELPSNYHLTFSASERDSDADIRDLLASGVNVAVVSDLIEGKAPNLWYDHDVIDGDITDYRPSDPEGVVVFLKPKGKARSKTSAPRGKFVRKNANFKVASI